MMGGRSGVAVIVFAVCGSSCAGQQASFAILNARIVTMDEARPQAQAIACRDERIVAVGSNEEIDQLVGRQTKVLRLSGELVLPGFIEGHGHFVGLGRARLMLDLTRSRSFSEIVDQVAVAAQKAEPGRWILGRGWHQDKWTEHPSDHIGGYPRHNRLSAVSPRNPVLLAHASGHMCLVNAVAMHLSSIDHATPNPPGGEIVKDEAGQPTGVLRETAQNLCYIAHERSEQSLSDLAEAVNVATAECLSKGITSFQDAGSSFAVIDYLRTLADKHELGLRMWVMVREDNAQLRRKLPQYRMIGYGNDYLTVRAIKCAIDGALGAHGAWLLEPYDDLPSSTGLNTTPIPIIREAAQLAVAHDLQLCVHAIGDRANRETLDVFAEIFGQHPSTEGRRWRIEHAQHLHPDDIPRFAQLGVIASMQGIHCPSDAVFVVKRLGLRRAEQGAYMWRALVDSGAIVSNGTDTPVEDVDPLNCFHATVTRKLANATAFFPKQTLTREEALRSYTLHAAYAAFEDQVKGSLAPGKLADMVVLSRDILSCSEEDLLDTRVLYTILGGRVRFAASAD
jgi:hypothetical protein